jgi:hypothetical protein
MSFFLSFTPTAQEDLKELKGSPHSEKRFKAVSKALKYLQENPRHPSLQTHKYSSLSGPNGEEVFEAYAEQDTPAAYRIFFFYGKTRGEIVIISITQHP